MVLFFFFFLSNPVLNQPSLVNKSLYAVYEITYDFYFMVSRFSCVQLAIDINASASLISVAHLTLFSPLQPDLHWSGPGSADLSTYCTIALAPLLPTHLSFPSRQARSNRG